MLSDKVLSVLSDDERRLWYESGFASMNTASIWPEECGFLKAHLSMLLDAVRAYGCDKLKAEVDCAQRAVDITEILFKLRKAERDNMEVETVEPNEQLTNEHLQHYWAGKIDAITRRNEMLDDIARKTGDLDIAAADAVLSASMVLAQCRKLEDMISGFKPGGDPHVDED